MAVKKTKTEAQETPDVFSKDQLVKSDKFRNHRDLVAALLDDNKKYTMEQVNDMITEFMKGKVK